MGTRFLIDTNILIYYIGNVIPKASVKKMNQVISESFNISIISKVEFLGGIDTRKKITEKPSNLSVVRLLYR